MIRISLCVEGSLSYSSSVWEEAFRSLAVLVARLHGSMIATRSFEPHFVMSRRPHQGSTLRVKVVFSSRLAIPIFFAGCGGASGGSSTALQSPYCRGCQFVYSPSHFGQILPLGISGTGALRAPTAIAGPANSTGIVYAVPSRVTTRGLPVRLGSPESRHPCLSNQFAVRQRVFDFARSPFAGQWLTHRCNGLSLCGREGIIASGGDSFVGRSEHSRRKRYHLRRYGWSEWGADARAGLSLLHWLGRGTSSMAGADGFLFATDSINGSISSYSIDALTSILTQVAGSAFPAATVSGDTLYSNGKRFVPDASSNHINGF